jgi:hypothetical protein
MIEKWRFQKTVIAPISGQKLIIRRINFFDLMLEAGISVSTSDELVSGLDKLAKSGDTQMEEKITRFLLANGIVEPEIWFGEPAQCPEGQLCYKDLAADINAIVQEISIYSGTRAVRPQSADAEVDGNSAEVRE